MEVFNLLAAGAIIFVGSFFATVSGFGFALVATPPLCLVMPVKWAIIFVLVLTVLLRALTMYRVWGQFNGRTVMLTSIGSFIGMLPGSKVLNIIPVVKLELFLGVVLILATLLMSLQYTVPIKNKTLGRLGAGVLSGFFGASTSVSGPPLVLYFLNEHTAKEEMRANMIWIFGVTGILMVGASYWAGNISAVENWDYMYTMIPGTLLGIWAGEKMFRYLNQQLFRRLSLCIVLAGALMMLAHGISEIL
ncbi:sulfite exporter TauE/SafE family protein [Phascolarctobacterium sp.]|uniref:sulfite exporter TauE/SafE family protein n=1 Tax=Phascolarctobacterium sp. TaxID=2049039 RepID=UPI003862F1DC